LVFSFGKHKFYCKFAETNGQKKRELHLLQLQTK